MMFASHDAIKENQSSTYAKNYVGIAPFPKTPPEKKTPDGEESANPDCLVCRAIRAVKAAVPEMLVFADIALDPYTTHGHDGVLNAAGTDVESSAGACADVYPILFLGKNAFGVTPFAAPQKGGTVPVNVMALNPNTPRGGDPLGQRGSLGWKAYRTSEILYDLWMARCEVAVSRL